MSAGDAHTGGLRHHAYYSPYHFLLGVCFVFALCLRLVAGFRPRMGERRGRDVPWTDGTIGFDQLGRGGVQRVGGGGV